MNDTPVATSPRMQSKIRIAQRKMEIEIDEKKPEPAP